MALTNWGTKTVSESNLWDLRFLEIASLLSTWSKDPSTKVGAVATLDRRILATGYNGFPQKVHDTPARLDNREIKNQLMAHAETNLLTSAAMNGVSLRRSTVYCTWPPCASCAGQLINTGVYRLVVPVTDVPVRWYSNFQLSAEILREGGIWVDVIPVP